MNRFALPLVGFVLLVIVFGIALHRSDERAVIPSALIGKPAPEFTLPDLLNPGATISSTAFKGSWVLLNVWGTWCRECQIEHPELLNISRTGKVRMVGIDYKDDDAKARQWLAQLGNPFEAVAVDKQGDAAINLGVYGAPETFLVNPEGIIVHKVVGVITAQKWQQDMLPLIEGAAK